MDQQNSQNGVSFEKVRVEFSFFLFFLRENKTEQKQFINFTLFLKIKIEKENSNVFEQKKKKLE